MSARGTVAIRADASLQIGGGHIMRCLTLADALSASGWHCVFVCRALQGHMIEQIRAMGYAVADLKKPCSEFPVAADDVPHAAWLEVSWEVDAEETESVLMEHAPIAWLVVDHYALDDRWISKVAKGDTRVMAIDEANDRALSVDILLDQTWLYQTPRKSAAKRSLLGPHYALLRPEFVSRRKASLERRASDNASKRVLVSTGLMDVGGGAILACEALAHSTVEVDVAVGSGASSLKRLEAVAGRADNITLHVDSKNMGALMCASDLAIGAAGSTSWERACLGVPSLLFVLAENQRTIADAFMEAGAALLVGHPNECNGTELRDQTEDLLANRGRLNAMSDAASKLCDGEGTWRVANTIQATG